MEEQVKHLSDLEGLNSELEEVLSGLRGREENYASRIASLEARLEAVAGLLEEEKKRSAEKDLFISSARSAVKDKEDEAEKMWRAAEELKGELALERFSGKDREAQLSKLSKIRDGLEQRLAQAASEGTRSEEGFLLKIELLKKEMREQAKRCAELERSLAAAGIRLEEALEDAELKGKLLAAAELQNKELVKETGSLKKTGGEAAAERGRETAARFTARIHELEARLAESSSGSLEKFGSLQDELAAAGSALRSAQEESATVKAREGALLRELQDAQEKWKLAAAQLNNAVSKLRAAQNDNEVNGGRLKTLEAECGRLRTALIKAEKASSSLMSKGAEAQDGEAERLVAAMQEQSEKYAALSRERDALLLSREKFSSKNISAQAEAAVLREELAKSGAKAADALAAKDKNISELSSGLEALREEYARKLREMAAAEAGYKPEFEELVAGVAHQVANSISIIRSHAEFCSDSPNADGAKESVSVIVRNIGLLQKKIETIMDFSRPVVPQRSPESLPVIAAEVLEALRAAGRLGQVKAGINAAGGLKPIKVDRVRLAAALEQLLLNAVEAMPRGGALQLNISSSRGRQRLEVADSGDGVEKKNLSAVFHPFFTTRPGKMGLGLTLARNVARAHGGDLELVSEPGRGARAILELPEV